MSNPPIRIITALAALALAVPAMGQTSNATRGTPAQPGSAATATGDAASAPTPARRKGMGIPLEEISLFAVIPPEPRRYAKHDLVEVIVNETSIQKFEQSLDTNKKYDLMAELAQFPSIQHLLELQLRNGDTTNPAKLDLTYDQKYNGDGEFERKDKFTARLTATVIDVKPNGTLVLEARETIQSDDETSTMVLAGVCRSEDITTSNTIQSGQLANLNLRVDHEGRVKEAADKGWIPRILEAIFNF